MGGTTKWMMNRGTSIKDQPITVCFARGETPGLRSTEAGDQLVDGVPYMREPFDNLTQLWNITIFNK